MIYSQNKDDKKRDICFGCATGNLWENQGGTPPSLEEIIEWYKANRLDPEKGVTGNGFKRAILNAPMGEVKVSDMKLIYTKDGNKLNLAPFVLLNRVKTGSFVFVIKRGVKLDQNNTVIRGTGGRGKHAVALARVINSTACHAFLLENSLGKSYGEVGYFKLKLEDLKDIVFEIWELVF